MRQQYGSRDRRSEYEALEDALWGSSAIFEGSSSSFRPTFRRARRHRYDDW